MKVRQDGNKFYWIHPTTGKLTVSTVDVQKADAKTEAIWQRDAMIKIAHTEAPGEEIEWVV